MFEFNPNLVQEGDSDDDEGEAVYFTRNEDVSGSNITRNCHDWLMGLVARTTTTIGCIP